MEVLNKYKVADIKEGLNFINIIRSVNNERR